MRREKGDEKGALFATDHFHELLPSTRKTLCLLDLLSRFAPNLSLFWRGMTMKGKLRGEEGEEKETEREKETEPGRSWRRRRRRKGRGRRRGRRRNRKKVRRRRKKKREK